MISGLELSVYWVRLCCIECVLGQVVHSMDLRDFLNTLMFECAIKPGLSRVLVELLNFETASFRCRPVAGLHATAENKLGGTKHPCSQTAERQAETAEIQAETVLLADSRETGREPRDRQRQHC